MSAVADLLGDEAVRTMFRVLDGDGETARIAGGAVRDALIGRRPHEVDFATTALPQEVQRRAGAAGLKTVPTGIEHGTVTVLVRGQPFEVTTLRRDVETDGRHALVAFGRDWAEDARRRDFTINGLFLDAEGGVHDHVDGLDDLKAGRVRFIGEARARIREDYLRILRFFRFLSGYGDGQPDPEAMSAAVRERAGLQFLSAERIRVELLKLLVTRRAEIVVELMAGHGLLGPLLGGVPRTARLQRLIALDRARNAPPDAVLRLGALALFVREDAERLRAGLRLSNAEAERLIALSGTAPRLHPDLSDPDRRRALYLLGPAVFRDRVRLAWAGSDEAARHPGWLDLLMFAESWVVPVMPMRAADLLARGVPRGPALGAALRKAEQAWIAADFPNEPRALEQIIASVAAGSGVAGAGG
ncbi:CCA tRNA nucleotidyltransferase [Terrihabitans sp. B22-R8]|uniref:CCA tRNA nucleotidyltransferase n=1 Tax=Terrihabitans sp. B22-R8 TaxID=3425128 RepID=UPI00403CFBC0